MPQQALRTVRTSCTHRSLQMMPKKSYKIRYDHVSCRTKVTVPQQRQRLPFAPYCPMSRSSHCSVSSLQELLSFLVHGSFNHTSEEEGCLTLAKASKLLGEDIQDVPMAAQLVILHACSTALGQATADSMMSIGRSFLMAGVPCCIATLWNVDAAAAAEHATLLYQHLGSLHKGLSSGMQVTSVQAITSSTGCYIAY